MFQESFKGVLRKFTRCFESVSNKFQETSRGCFKCYCSCPSTSRACFVLLRVVSCVQCDITALIRIRAFRQSDGRCLSCGVTGEYDSRMIRGSRPSYEDGTAILFSEATSIIGAVCAVIFSILGTVGNMFTILALTRSPLRSHPTTMCLISLAISDLIFSTYNLPLTAHKFFNRGCEFMCLDWHMCKYVILPQNNASWCMTIDNM